MRSLFVLIALCISTVSYAQKSKSYPPEFPDAREEVYKTVDGTDLKIWIWEPGGARADRPAIVFFFGGGWNAGSPGQFQEHCRYLASRGMVAMTADYRVRSRHNVLADRCVADAKSAIRWIRKNAERLGINPEQIVAGGGSAGGHLAAVTGIVPGLDEKGEDLKISSVPNAMALFNPALVLAPFGGLAVDEEKLSSLAARTGVPPKAISPIHHLKNGLPPTIIFHGTADTTVPYQTAQAFTKASQAKGNQVDLVSFQGASHGFFNYGRGGIPGEAFQRTLLRLDQFLIANGLLDGEPTLAVPASTNVHLRSRFENSRSKFLKTGKGCVAFIGGSITQMDGYRPMVSKYLAEKFPETEFTFINAGLSSTCSTTGAMRLQSEVLKHRPDLLFVEFAVNDDQDAAHAARECRRGMEGILRNALTSHPKLDVVVTHFVNPPMLELLQNGKTPVSSGSHERVVSHYGVSSSDLAREVAERITKGTLDWKTYGGTHPKPAGNRVAADLIADMLDTAWSEPLDPKFEPQDRRLPKPLDKNSYDSGDFLPADQVVVSGSWERVIPNWSSIQGSFRSQYADRKLYCCEQPGDELKVQFTGRGIGAFVLAGPDAGMLEYSIDGGPMKTVDLYHRYSRGLHYPRTVMFDADLKPGDHSMVIKLSAQKNPSSRGPAARILEFTVNR